MLNSKYIKRLVAALALASGLGTAAYAAPAGIKVGALTCDVSGGLDVIKSKHGVACTYEGAGGKSVEHYVGHISSIGANLGYTKESKVVWAVFAPTSDYKARSLHGEYVGVTAGVAVGVGGNANVLVGGFDKSISLQPVSLQGSEGVNIAAGFSSLKLTAAN